MHRHTASPVQQSRCCKIMRPAFHARPVIFVNRSRRKKEFAAKKHKENKDLDTTTNAGSLEWWNGGIVECRKCLQGAFDQRVSDGGCGSNFVSGHQLTLAGRRGVAEDGACSARALPRGLAKQPGRAGPPDPPPFLNQIRVAWLPANPPHRCATSCCSRVAVRRAGRKIGDHPPRPRNPRPATNEGGP